MTTQLKLFAAITPGFDGAREFFRTPDGIARYAVRHLVTYPGPTPRILDPGAGDGCWGQAARQRWPGAHIVGVDLPGVSRAVAYSYWYSQDFLTLAERMQAYHQRFDIVCGNPPFSLAEDFIRAGVALLNPGGVLVFFLRLTFLASQSRGAGLWRDLPPRDVAVSMRRPSFTGNSATDKDEYALFTWQRGYTGPSVLRVPFDYTRPDTWT
jgi:hypothetical protein